MSYHVDLEHLNLETLQKAMRHIRKCQNELQKAVVHRHNARQVVAELQLTADLQLAACRIGRALVSVGRNPNTQSPGGAGYSVINLGIANLTPTAKTDLANRLLGMLEQYRVVWYTGNIPHGLNESLNVLSTMLKQYLPEETLSSD
ncbi:uncharacterized protein LOC106170414 isoform X1 [Lingula anatina]|uniref:Uncharacterized protein LOC106170414 isoform X1 n=2 Tax=Lingula anatina TaxID=7574 RepID=A0A1S3J640_LINAN|nr:uncharacterized protein LOC106170414 isoform X1 [Lingula anatina]|eukprot:XP_013405716.1 uncharacterized protein LOC106170414 isoform X1 [Lingula anatina]